MANTTPSITVACDGSDQSLQAVKLAAELAKATGNPLKLLSVFPRVKEEHLILNGLPPRILVEAQERYGHKVFKAAREALSGILDPTEEILLKGDPAPEIIKYLKANPDTHLVLGRRGHSTIRSLMLGSVSEKVVRHATSPVTVISK